MLLVETCKVENPVDFSEQLFAVLPKDLTQEILRYRNAMDQTHRIIGRLMILKALKEDGKSELFQSIKRTADNKPMIAGWKPFNISHSGNYVMLAYSDEHEELGIDIEENKPVNINELLTYFHEEEQQYILASQSLSQMFYTIWTRKEAVLKASGDGLMKGLNFFSSIYDDCHLNNRNYTIQQLNAPNGYSAAVAATSPIGLINYRSVTVEDLLLQLLNDPIVRL